MKQHIIMNSHGDVTTLIDIPDTPGTRSAPKFAQRRNNAKS